MRAPTVRALGLLLPGEAPAGSGTGPEPPLLSLGHPAATGAESRRATRECLLGLAAVEAMLEDGGAPREAIAGPRTALVYATAAAYGASNRNFIEGGGSIHFAYTAPAVVPAQVAIEFGVTGPYTILLGGPPATLRAIWHAAVLLERGTCDRALVLAVETFAECADLHARARRLMGRPLIESAGCLWLEPGRGELILASRRRGAGRRSSPGIGETFGCGPLLDLARRRRDEAAPLELTGRWRGEEVTLAWRPVAETPSAGGGRSG